jgi:dTMP kinase
VFITFEGGEGSGKSTQMQRLARHLEASGREVVCTREPGGTDVAEALRAVLLDPELVTGPRTELLILAAARADHVARLIRPALNRQAIVLSDRFDDSTRVYQGLAGGIDSVLLETTNRLATEGLTPELTLLFDIDPTLGLRRVDARGELDGLDRRPLAFHQAVRAGFLELAHRWPERFRVIDADGGIDEVEARMLRVLPEELR